MSKLMTKSQIVSILKEADAGIPVKELCRQHGIASSTFYNEHGRSWQGIGQYLCGKALALTKIRRRVFTPVLYR